MKKKTKHKHQSSVPSGFFIYKGIEAEYADINPDICNEYIDDFFKSEMRRAVAENKNFCEKYCNKEFWENSFGEELCFLYRIKKKLNEFHMSKSSKGKYKCKLRNSIC